MALVGVECFEASELLLLLSFLVASATQSNDTGSDSGHQQKVLGKWRGEERSPLYSDEFTPMLAELTWTPTSLLLLPSFSIERRTLPQRSCRSPGLNFN